MGTDPNLFPPVSNGAPPHGSGALAELARSGAPSQRSTDRGLGSVEKDTIADAKSSQTVPGEHDAPDADGADAEDPDAEVEARLRPLPHPEEGEFQGKDQRPRWERAKMPKGEWDRALASNDAQIAKTEPGSEEFARLMDVRIRLHFPPPKDLNWKQIESYKSSQYRNLLAGELEAELKRSDKTGRVRTAIYVAAAVLFMAVVGLAFTMLSKAPDPNESAAPQPAPKPARPTAQAPTVTAKPSEPAVTAATAESTAAAPITSEPSATATTAPSVKPTGALPKTAGPTATTAAPTATTAPTQTAAPSAKPTATNDSGLYFEPGKR